MLARSAAGVRRRPRPQGSKGGTATPAGNTPASTIMVLRMLGSAAAVLGGGNSGSRALVAASTTNNLVASTRSIFGARLRPASESRAAAAAFATSGGSFARSGRKTPLHREHRQQQHNYSSALHQRCDRAASVSSATSGDGASTSTSTSMSSRCGHQRQARSSLPSSRLMSTAGGDGKGFWADDDGFEEPVPTF
ncbi:unnamed protein product, partial [Scytosiphon promiscuus]